jgi:hypothetical protein
MGETHKTTEEIRREIERVRAKMARDVSALEITVRETFDLRHHIRERPFAFTGSALLLGFLLGFM